MSAPVGVSSRTVLVQGARIHYLQAGDGPPVLLVHGIAASVDDWRYNIGALAERFSVYAVDLPGFGDSDIPSSVGGMEDALQFLDGSLDALGLPTVALVGNSMGGLICGQYAARRAERVSHLLLVDPVGINREVSLQFRLLTLPLIGEGLLRPNPTLGRWAAAGLFANATLVPDDWRTTRMADRGPRARRYLLRALRSGTTIFGLRREVLLLDRLRALQIPTLIVWGAHDRVVSAGALALVRRHLPRAQTHLFEDAGHVPMLECPDEFNGLALEFLSSGTASDPVRPGSRSTAPRGG